MNEIKTVILQNGDIYVPMLNFDDWKDFLSLVSTIKEVVKPDTIRYQGITDMSGYFVKEAQRVELEYDEMLGSGMVIRKNDINSNSMDLVNEWIQQIIDYCN